MRRAARYGTVRVLLKRALVDRPAPALLSALVGAAVMTDGVPRRPARSGGSWPRSLTPAGGPVPPINACGIQTS